MSSIVFYKKQESGKITNHVLNSIQPSSLSKCATLCYRDCLCKAFSLADDLSCVLGLTQNKEDTDDTQSAKYYTVE